jgi:hypothetical protein
MQHTYATSNQNRNLTKESHMELKEFITQTISAISDATTELQATYAEDGIIINPPTSHQSGDVYMPGNSGYTSRRVQNIHFDVAVTASSETSGNAKAGIKVLSAQLGAGGSKAVAAEQVSRVSFDVPLTLKPSTEEERNEAEGRRETSRLRGQY